MTYVLAIGERTYSSWSLRGWLLFAAFGIPVETRVAKLYDPAFARLLKQEFPPARTVPALTIAGIGTIWDSLAIAETLAERHADAGLWPADPAARATARVLAAEMHAGFGALRNDCPMNLAHAWGGFVPSDAVKKDLERLEVLWDHARARFGGASPWLFGDYCVADAFFAPVAARIAGYGLPVSDAAAAYVAAHLAETRFRRWRATGRAAGEYLKEYEMGLARTPWPGPAPLAAEPVDGEVPINAACPFSGKPVAPDSLARIAGTVLGFCNPGCRDRAVADPEAWPEVMALLR